MAPPSLDEMEQRRVRRLKNLVVNEVSIVNRAANQHASIVLAKRDQQEEPVQTISIEKALPMWNTFVELVAVRDKCSKSVAIDRAMREQPELFELAKTISGAGTVLKDGRPTGIPDRKPNPVESMDTGGRIVSRTRDSGHFAGNPARNSSPFDYTSSTEDGTSALARYRDQYATLRADGKAAVEARNMAFRNLGPDGMALSAADTLNAEQDGEVAAAAMVAEQRAKERDANQLRRPQRGTAMSNGSGQSSLGVNSAPNRSM